jgi:Holliday junction resolvase RusA-like endonuclease
MSNMQYHFVVPMRCATKARPRVSRHGTYMPAEYMAWKASFAVHVRSHGMVEPLQGPVSLTVAVEVTGCARGDADNYAGAVMDALNGLVYADDKQVKALTVLIREHGPTDMVTILISDIADNSDSTYPNWNLAQKFVA